MNTFLSRIAELFYRSYGAEINRLAFVFPNRRAGLFFQKYLAEISEKPLFSPTVLTINDLFVQLSGKQSADRISMLFLLYEIYTRISGSSETFDEFLYWGEMLLNDFDDVDKYMADARMLFTNVTDLRAIEDDFSFLSEEQIAAIRSFWSSFYPRNDTPNQQHFLAVWQLLYELYDTFRNRLAEEGMGYEGMILREVVEQLERGLNCQLPYEKIVFVGLNALSRAEERFLFQLQKRGIADFYWDYESDKVTDPDNKASYFVKQNKMNFPSSQTIEPDKRPLPEIEVIGIPSGIGQAKMLHTLLEKLVQQGKMSDSDALRTAVVLPDEHLLIPVLNAIPKEIKHINVTMGYPLGGTPVAALMEYVLTLQKNIRYVDGRPQYYYRDVLPILNHSYVMTTRPEVISDLVKHITENNRIYMSHEELDQTPLLSVLFEPMHNLADYSDYLIRILEELNRQMQQGRNGQDDEEEETLTMTAHDIEQEFVFHYFATVNRMKEVMQESRVEMKPDTYFRLLKRMTDAISIPFRGEPLSGLQIMGVLETRALDFDRLIILSMNEGIFPLKKVANSFIPYNLRRGFGLPTYEHQDSVWAYHFYRLIHRASQVSLLYDTRSNGLQTGEMSRFIYQLRYHYEVAMQHKLVTYNVSSATTPKLVIQKDDKVMKRLHDFLQGGKRALSASAINTYLDCPLKFYFSVVENVQEEEEVTENIKNNVFGSILHKVMEELYHPFCKKQVTADLLKLIKKDNALVSGAIARAFASEFFKTDVVRPLTGQNFLIGEMIRKYVEKILERDSQLTPFRYVQSEMKVNVTMPVNDQTVVQLKGFIDRMDEVNNRLRIIDYKSGSGSSAFNSISELFRTDGEDRPKAVMQVFLYAWMYRRLSGNACTEITPGIYYVRSLFAPDFNPGITYHIDRTHTESVDDFGRYAFEFEEELRKCLADIFAADVPFTQTPSGKACGYCMFKSICGR